MSLIKCPECKKMISDKAITCPHCGLPLETIIKCPNCNEILEDFTSCNKCGLLVVKPNDTSVTLAINDNEYGLISVTNANGDFVIGDRYTINAFQEKYGTYSILVKALEYDSTDEIKSAILVQDPICENVEDNHLKMIELADKYCKSEPYEEYLLLRLDDEMDSDNKFSTYYDEVASMELFERKVECTTIHLMYKFLSEEVPTKQADGYRTFLKQYETWKDLDDIIKNAYSAWVNTISTYAGYLASRYNEINKVKIVDKRNFIDNIFMVYAIQNSEYLNTLDALYNACAELGQYQIRASELRELQKATRGKVSPIAFSLKGLVIGSIEAGMINAVTGSFYNVKNKIGNNKTDNQMEDQKNNIFKSRELHAILTNGMKNDIKNLKHI